MISRHDLLEYKTQEFIFDLLERLTFFAPKLQMPGCIACDMPLEKKPLKLLQRFNRSGAASCIFHESLDATP